jgi:hypothetical protein
MSGSRPGRFRNFSTLLAMPSASRAVLGVEALSAARFAEADHAEALHGVGMTSRRSSATAPPMAAVDGVVLDRHHAAGPAGRQEQGFPRRAA